jgi:hypothetical protein
MFMTFVKLQSMAEKRREVQQTLKSLASLIQVGGGLPGVEPLPARRDETDFLLLGRLAESRGAGRSPAIEPVFGTLGAKCLMSRPPEMAIHTVAASTEFRSLNPEHSTTDR